MCADIARWLRMLGYDTTYAHQYESKYGAPVKDDDLITECITDFRVLITRDHEMLVKMAFQVDKMVSQDPNYRLKFEIPSILNHLIDNCKNSVDNRSFKPYLLMKKGDIETELTQILDEFHISAKYDANTARCPVCNSKLSKIEDKQKYKNQIPEKVFQYHDEFWTCSNPSCSKIYWFGTHFQDIISKLEKVNHNHEM